MSGGSRGLRGEAPERGPPVRRGGGLALAALALALTGCETTAEKSARLAQSARHKSRAQAGLTITKSNPHVEVASTAVVHDQNGTAAVVALRSRAATPLHEVPIAITVKDAHGTVLYANSTPGLAHPLVSVPLLLPGRQTIWIDDQIQVSGAASVSAKVGEAPAASGQLPQISSQGAHLFEDPTNGVGVEGTLVNHSSVAQQELVVFATGTRAGKVVAAGRAVVPTIPAGASTPYRVFFVGKPQGTQLQISVPATTLR